MPTLIRVTATTEAAGIEEFIQDCRCVCRGLLSGSISLSEARHFMNAISQNRSRVWIFLLQLRLSGDCSGAKMDRECLNLMQEEYKKAAIAVCSFGR